MRNGEVSRQLEDILGCKWSLSVLAQVHRGVHRPGQLEKAITGISTKILNERLRKLVGYGILVRQEFAELPPRVEYRFSAFGEKLFAILEQIAALEQERQT